MTDDVTPNDQLRELVELWKEQSREYSDLDGELMLEQCSTQLREKIDQ